jgi:hypothetical protein
MQTTPTTTVHTHVLMSATTHTLLESGGHAAVAPPARREAAAYEIHELGQVGKWPAASMTAAARGGSALRSSWHTLAPMHHPHKVS